LWYGCANEGVWERADGQAEPWEAQEFWSQDALEGALECAESDSECRKLEQLWKEKVISNGQTEPSVSSEDAVHAAMKHYGLFDPNPGATDTRAREATPTSMSTRGRVFRLLLWAAILCSIVLLFWRTREPSKPRPGSGELSWFLADQIPRYGGRVTLSSPPVAITTNWSYWLDRSSVEVQLPGESFYDAWRFLRQLYGAPLSVLEDAKGLRRGSFKDTLSGMTVDLRQSTNCAVIYFRKTGS